MLTQQEGDKLTGKLAMQAADAGIKSFVSKILKALKAKNLTFGKLLQVYAIVEKAYKDIQTVMDAK